MYIIRLIGEERYHEDRIGHIERLFSALSLNMGGIARKNALLRDKGDKLAKTVQVGRKLILTACTCRYCIIIN